MQICPFELQFYADAEKRRRDYNLHIVATHGAWLLNVHMPKGKRVTADELLGKRSVSMSQFSSLKDAIRYARENPDQVG